jgi:hypothetical protein
MAGTEAGDFKEVPEETAEERDARLAYVTPGYKLREEVEWLRWKGFRQRQKARPVWQRLLIAPGAWFCWPFIAIVLLGYWAGYSVLYYILWVLFAPIRMLAKDKS